MNCQDRPADLHKVGIRNDLDWPYGANIGLQDSTTVRDRLVAWALQERLTLVPRPRRLCLHWLIGQARRCGALAKSDHNGRIVDDLHAALDHATFWTRDRKPTLILAQPYRLHHEVLDRIAEQWPIDVSTTDDSPWYGYGTHGVFLTARENPR